MAATLTRKVMLGTLAFWVLIALAAALSFYSIERTRAAVDETTHHTLATAALNEHFHASLNRAAGEAASYIESREEADRQEALEALDEAQSTIARIRSVEQEAHSLEHDDHGEGAIVEQQQVLLDQTRQAVTVLLQAVQAGDRAAARSAFETLDNLEGSAEALEERSHEQQEHDVAHAQEVVDTAIANTTLSIISSFALFTLLAVIALYMLQRRVVRPIKELSLAAERVAGGDLDQPVRVTSRDEVGGLQAAFNQMVSSLKEQRAALAQRSREIQANMEAQQQLLDTVKELSTPLLPVSEDVVVLPVVGYIDTRRAQSIMDTLLHGVAEQRARIAILDITGIKAIDTHVMGQMMRAIQAVELLGAQGVLSGISAPVAQMLVEQGVDLGQLRTYQSLRAAIEGALKGEIGRRHQPSPRSSPNGQR